MTKKQAAPTKPVERFQFIPMAKIVESHINPRKTFDQARLNCAKSSSESTNRNMISLSQQQELSYNASGK